VHFLKGFSVLLPGTKPNIHSKYCVEQVPSVSKPCAAFEQVEW
jgi:hypothetical protein